MAIETGHLLDITDQVNEESACPMHAPYPTVEVNLLSHVLSGECNILCD